MSITDELREFADEFERTEWNGLAERAREIADRIDAEHERAVTAAHSNGITKYGSMVAREYVKLPVDADGVPWHIGDSTVLEGRAVTVCGFKAMMTEVYQCNVTNEVLKWHMYFSGGKGFAYECDKFRHVQPDTWENIIEDAMRYARETNMPYPAVSHKGDELVERCRRLAGEA